MLDLLNEKEAAAAQEQGWSLAPVYDMAKDVWEVAVFATTADVTPFTALAWVTERAKKLDPVCAKALQLIAISRINNARKGKPRGSKTNARKPR